MLDSPGFFSFVFSLAKSSVSSSVCSVWARLPLLSEQVCLEQAHPFQFFSVQCLSLGWMLLLHCYRLLLLLLRRHWLLLLHCYPARSSWVFSLVLFFFCLPTSRPLLGCLGWFLLFLFFLVFLCIRLCPSVCFGNLCCCFGRFLQSLWEVMVGHVQRCICAFFLFNLFFKGICGTALLSLASFSSASTSSSTFTSSFTTFVLPFWVWSWVFVVFIWILYVSFCFQSCVTDWFP